MRFELIAAAAALLMGASLQGQPQLSDSVPAEAGVYLVTARVLSASNTGGRIAVGDQVYSVMGELPPAGRLAELTIRSSSAGRRVERIAGLITETPYDLGGSPPLAVAPRSGTYRVVGELVAEGIRVGESVIPVEHSAGRGWVHARIEGNRLTVIEQLGWSGNRLAGLRTSHNRPTHTENGRWVQSR